MKIDNLAIIEQLERLGAAFPWDAVDIWVKREPEGRYDFTAYVRDNPKFALPSIFGSGSNPKEAVDDSIRQWKDRDPDIMRRKKIRELEEQIKRLQEVVIGLPPYRPGRELSNIEAPATVDV